MKNLVLALVLLAASFAWTNNATTAMMNAEYEYAACNVQFAKDFVAMRENCALLHDVPMMDSADYIADIDEALGDVEHAARDGNQPEFGGAMWDLRARMLSLGLAVLGDTFANKSVAFGNCVREDGEPIKDALETCRHEAMRAGKDAATEYVGNEIEYGNSQIAELDAMGADTMGMARAVGYGEELKADMGPAFDSGDEKEVSDLYQRHSRILLLFRLEKMISVMDYAEPIIGAGNNRNKERLLEDIADLKGDTEDLASDCAYSTSVDANYGLKNLECWNEGLALMGRFNSLQAVYWGGI